MADVKGRQVARFSPMKRHCCKADVAFRTGYVCLLCRFSAAGMQACPRVEAAGGRKAPRHEVAGSWAPAEQRVLWGFVRGARLRKFEEWRLRSVHNLSVLARLLKSGDLMFLARVISNSCAWQK